jgi:hypothetical protein
MVQAFTTKHSCGARKVLQVTSYQQLVLFGLSNCISLGCQQLLRGMWF